MLTGRGRRDHLSYLAVLRQVSRHTRRAAVVRLCAISVIAAVAAGSERHWIGLPLTLVVARTVLVDYLSARHEEPGTYSRIGLFRK